MTFPTHPVFLVQECASGTDWARSRGGFNPGGATACVHPSDLLPVIALDGLNCADTGDEIRPITQADLERLNQMRAFDVAVLALPVECPSLAEAVDWVGQQIEKYGENLDVLPITTADAGCYGAYTAWERGMVIVDIAVMFDDDSPSTVSTIAPPSPTLTTS